MLQPSFVAKVDRVFEEKHYGSQAVKIKPNAINQQLLAVLAALLMFLLPAAAKEKLEAPMRAAIVTLKDPACGAICPRWIMLEGRITDASPNMLKALLQKPEAAQLPILISSSGGSVTAAMIMGRMIRRGQHDVAVARTRLANCPASAKTCTIPQKPKSILQGNATETRAFCNSACPLVLAAGTSRSASANVFVGLHQVKTNWTQDKIVYRETYKIVNGKKKIISRKQISRSRAKSYTTVGLHKELRKSMQTYLKDMGVTDGFFTFMEKAPPNKIYAVKPQELKSIKLVTTTASVGNFLQP